MSSGTKQLPRAVSGFLVSLQLGSVLISVACVTSGGHRNRVMKSEIHPAATPPSCPRRPRESWSFTEYDSKRAAPHGRADPYSQGR